MHRRASVTRLATLLMVREPCPPNARVSCLPHLTRSLADTQAEAPAGAHTARDCLWHRGTHAWAAGGVQAQPLAPWWLHPRGSGTPLLRPGHAFSRLHHPAAARCFAAGPAAASQQGSSGGGARTRAAALAAASRLAASGKGVPTAAYLAALTVAMVGATYGSVPLYRLFCQATGACLAGGSVHSLSAFPDSQYVNALFHLQTAAGYGGTTQRAHSVEDVVARVGSSPETAAACAARTITITFNSDVADGLPWRFTPAQRSVTLHPGESALVFYTAVNNSTVPVTGVSTYNVAPARAGLYFRKVQCFCFEEQRLEPGETVDMPVLFYLDPEFVEDRKCDTMNTVTLSYTFWKAGDAATDTALEAAAARDFEADALAAEGDRGVTATAPAGAPA